MSSTSSTTPRNYLFHRLEWIPSALTLVLLLSIRQLAPVRNDTHASLTASSYSKAYGEANGSYSVEKLTSRICKTDARALCAASLHSVDPPCHDNPAFVSLLDSYTETSKCAMTLVTSEPDSKFTSRETLELVLHHTLEEAYEFSRLYFHVHNYVDEQALQKFVTNVFGSLGQFFIQSPNPTDVSEESLKVVVRVDGTAQETSVWLERNSWPRDEFLEVLQQVVDHYDLLSSSKSVELPDFSIAQLKDLGKDEFSGFFQSSFLPRVQDFLNDPTNMDAASASRESDNKHPHYTQVVPNDLLNTCLWNHYNKNTLVTSDCPQAMDEARIRIQELAYKRQHAQDPKRPASWWLWKLQQLYGFTSVGLVVLVVYQVVQTTSKQALQHSTTRNATLAQQTSSSSPVQWQQYLLLHTVVSLGLWMYGFGGTVVTKTHFGANQVFLDAALVSLTGFLVSGWWMRRHSESYVSSHHNLSYELPLLNESIVTTTHTMEDGEEETTIVFDAEQSNPTSL